MRRLSLHLGAYALILVVVAMVIPLDASFGSDDGAYGGAVYALRQGDWTLERPVPVVDQANEGWFNTSIMADGPRPYTAKPSYAMALAAVVRLVHGPPAPDERAGDLALGLHLLPLAGALISAAAAWLVAERWDRQASPLAFWLVALGPTLVNATTLWAHTLGTAFAGLALLGFVQLLPASRFSSSAAGPAPGLVPDAADQPRRRSAAATAAIMVATVAALAAMTAVRHEAVFWAAGLCATMMLVGRRPVVWVTAVAGGGTALVTWYGDRQWGAGLRADRLPIETSIEVLQGGPGWLASRLPAAWQLLVTSVGEGPAPVLTMLALVLATVAGQRLRVSPDDSARAIVLVATSVVVYLVRLAIAPGEEITGLLGAWPLLVVLLLATRWSPRRLTPLIAPTAVVLGTVLLTQYSASGGLQWGGRYLSTTFVAVGAAAAVAGHHLVRRHPAQFLALLVAPAVLGLSVSHRLHSWHHGFVEQATEAPSEVVITEVVPLPRIAWPALPTAFYIATPDDLDVLLAQLERAGVTSINVHGLSDTEVDGVAGYHVSGETDTVRFLTRSSPLAFDVDDESGDEGN